MPNAINIDPLRMLAKRASERIGNEAIAKRFERIALDRMLQDERNFRLASEADIARAPAWAREAAARGEELSVYRTNSALAARLHTVARRLADACAIAAADESKRQDDAASIAAARQFIAKFGRVNFETAARKALHFSRVMTIWRENDDAQRVCEPQTLVLLGGHVWRRITSVSELRTVGREFRNCLARTTRTSAYGGQLACGQAQFWVLRDYKGKGLIVAMAPAPEATHFVEVKGPNNTPVRSDNSDLCQLGIVIGVRPPTPEPPPPPPSTPPGIAAQLAAMSQPCRCSLCDPRYADRAFRLRRSVGAP